MDEKLLAKVQTQLNRAKPHKEPALKNDLSNHSCGDLARELYDTQGRGFCVGLMLHLTMYISGSYEDVESK